MRGNVVGKGEWLHKNLQERSREKKDVKQTDARCRMREKVQTVRHLRKGSECSKEQEGKNQKEENPQRKKESGNLKCAYEVKQIYVGVNLVILIRKKEVQKIGMK